MTKVMEITIEITIWTENTSLDQVSKDVDAGIFIQLSLIAVSITNRACSYGSEYALAVKLEIGDAKSYLINLSVDIR